MEGLAALCLKLALVLVHGLRWILGLLGCMVGVPGGCPIGMDEDLQLALLMVQRQTELVE